MIPEETKIIKNWFEKHTDEVENVVLETISLRWCKDDVSYTHSDFGKYKYYDSKNYIHYGKLKQLWSDE